MKQKCKLYLFVTLLIIITAGDVVSACRDKEGNNQRIISQDCTFNNPLTDLPWLKSLVDEWSQDSLIHKRIYQCTYNADKIGFLTEYCIDCPDASHALRSCSGVNLCVWGGVGITGEDNCGEFNIDFDNEVLIWELNKIS